MSRTITAVLALLAFVALLLVQFMPWSNQHASGFGATADSTAFTWGKQDTANSYFWTGGQTKSWYDSDWNSDQQNAVDQIRIAIPLLTVATILLLVGSLIAFSDSWTGGAILSLVGALVGAGAAWLFSVAINDLYNGNQVWQTSFYLAIGGTVLGLAAGIVGLATGNRRTMSS